MSNKIQNRIDTLVSDMRQAEIALKAATEKLNEAKKAIIDFAEATGENNIESELAKVCVYATGGSYLDPAKVKAIIGDGGYKACLSDKATSVAVRLTLKK